VIEHAAWRGWRLGRRAAPSRCCWAAAWRAVAAAAANRRKRTTPGSVTVVAGKTGVAAGVWAGKNDGIHSPPLFSAATGSTWVACAARYQARLLSRTLCLLRIARTAPHGTCPLPAATIAKTTLTGRGGSNRPQRQTTVTAMKATVSGAQTCAPATTNRDIGAAESCARHRGVKRRRATLACQAATAAGLFAAVCCWRRAGCSGLLPGACGELFSWAAAAACVGGLSRNTVACGAAVGATRHCRA